MQSRTQQHNAFQRGMTLQELKLRVKAGTARNAFIRKAATTYEESGHLPAHLLATHQNRIQGALSGHYTQTAEYFGRLALSGIRTGRKAALTPVQALIADWVRRESLLKAKMIADTDRDDVVDAIAAGLTEGLGTKEIATGIRKLTGFTPYRASVIARTETHAAATYGSIESVRYAEQTLDLRMLKAWLPTGDGRTRPEHLAMRGYPAIPLSEKFLVGGESMDRPGDPGASAGMLVNCRCSMVYEEAG